jgi:hypothetical protein
MWVLLIWFYVLAVVQVLTGKTTLNGTEGWQEASKSFTLAAGISTVVLQVVNVDDNYGNSQGDFAIDNISFTVCTPYYIFQYSYDDPTAVAASKVKWYDLNTPSQSSDSYEIKDPADHVAFKQIKDGTVAKVYFRVVIGDQTYLDGSRSEWDTMSALNACRAVSFSSIPITAGLNCAQCYTPKAVSITDVSAKTNKATKFVVNVDTIPTLKVPDVSPFCAGLTTRVLPSDTLSKAYTIDWGGKEQNLSKLTGSATPYTYIYKVTDVKSSCVSVPETLSITAKPAVKIKELSAKQECGKTTVTVDVDPTTCHPYMVICQVRNLRDLGI